MTPDAKSATKTTTAAKPLTIERTFDATPETLWTFWTDPKKYAKWIYPGSTDVAMHQFDVRVGGKVSFTMLIDQGMDMLNEGVFHVLDKPKRIESGSPDKSFLLVITFEPVDAKRTHMKVVITGVPPEHHAMATQGWGACMEKLERQLSAPGFSGSARGIAKDHYVEVTRWFNAAPEKVYGAWTSREMLPKFFWPIGTGRVDKLDLRVGGELKMGHVDQPDWNATWRFKQIVPHSKIVIIDVWPDGSGHEAEGTMEFTPENGGTRMKVRFGPFPTTGPFKPEDAASGSAMVADRLAEELETPGAGEGFRLQRTFNAPVAKVWEMWTTKAGLAKWWALSAKEMGYAFKVNTLDVKIGGAYDIVMSNKEHGELHNHGTYTQVVPHKRLQQRWDFDIFLAPGEKPYPIVITIDFEEVPTWGDQKGTKMTFTQGPMAKPDFTEGSRQGVRSNFAKLEKALAPTA